MNSIRINYQRLKEDIAALSEIGREMQHELYRMAFTEADMQGRRWLQRRMQDAGLTISMDGAANVFGRLKDADQKPSVLLGSHIDTVPAAGHLDGTLGVLVALECLRRVQEEGIQTRHPLEMVAFSDEEGRFGGMFGSQAVCGLLTPEVINNATDLDGVRLIDAMQMHGLDAMDALQARRDPASLHAYLELHIEQGPVLDRLGIPVGIVDQITGLYKWSIRLIGNADHAGTTPMPMRRDAFMGLADFSHEIGRVLDENGTENSVATIGKVDLFPGSANTVPGVVEFSLDIRDPDKEALMELGDAFRRVLSSIARRRGLMFEFDILNEIEPVGCDPRAVEAITQSAHELNVPFHRMPSGAAHDAQVMATLTRVGMIFVPSVGGRSHSSAEWTHDQDIEIGANVMLSAAIELANS